MQTDKTEEEKTTKTTNGDKSGKANFGTKLTDLMKLENKKLAIFLFIHSSTG